LPSQHSLGLTLGVASKAPSAGSSSVGAEAAGSMGSGPEAEVRPPCGYHQHNSAQLRGE
jgi:hypothetical protein